MLAKWKRKIFLNAVKVKRRQPPPERPGSAKARAPHGSSYFLLWFLLLVLWGGVVCLGFLVLDFVLGFFCLFFKTQVLTESRNICVLHLNFSSALQARTTQQASGISVCIFAF
jgi:hypothetical protein